MAGSGKVVYWESISSAATFVFMKRERSGVEYLISGMSAGEKATGIVNLETAGFILSFNSGRLAYMSVRDSHGRPSISVQFLRSAVSPSYSGLLGSIRHVFSQLSLRGDVAAVRADRSSGVGARNIAALSSKGRVQAWRIHRGGHSEVVGEADVRDDVVSAMRDADPVSHDFPADSFEALDLTWVPKGLEPKYLELSRLSDAMASDDSTVQHFLVLVSLTRKNESRYAMAEVILTATGCQVGVIRPITSYSTPCINLDGPHAVRPRIYLPRPALVAFVVFERAAVIASLAIPPESPDSQLQSDSHILPASFEDVVDFRGDNVHDILGSGFEETQYSPNAHDEGRPARHKGRNPAVLLMVRGAGVVRIVTTEVDRFASDHPPQVSAKSRLEQAVFFGAKQDSPLTFDRRREINFSRDEIAKAALEVSTEILGSTTSYISTMPASMEDNLTARAEALERMMSHLKSIGTDLDRRTRWSLLFNAEKMHVALKLWKLHESFTANRPADDKKSMVGEIVEFIHEDQKHNPIAKIGEVDRVRHWFVNDVFRLELFVAWAYEVIKVLYKDNLLDEAKMTLMIYEAMQINSSSHLAALAFRKSSLSFYGLGNEKLRMGILIDGYGDLPEPWTGCHYLANNFRRLVELAGQWYEKLDGAGDKTRSAKRADLTLAAKLFDDLPVLTDGMLTSVLEFARWGISKPEQKAMAQNFAKVYDEDREEKTISLARSGQWEEGARIAEKHGALAALAVILLDHIEELEARLASDGFSQMERQVLKNLRESKKNRVEELFARYRQDFAFPCYDYLLRKHGVDALLEFSLDKHKFKTEYLRSRPELAKISWINDVQQENDLDHASETLLSLALRKESQVWSKKVELSLGKLALLAKHESLSSGEGFKVKADEIRYEDQLKEVDQELITITVQEALYGQLSPSTYNAVDEAAALNLAMEAHAGNIPKRQKALYQVFEDGTKRLLRHEALDPMTLIDMLTLVSLKPQTAGTMPDPFWLALKVADSSCHVDEVKEAKRLLWRRLYIRDNWTKINDTSLKDDQEVVVQLSHTSLFRTFSECVKRRKKDAHSSPLAPLPKPLGQGDPPLLLTDAATNISPLVEDVRNPFQPRPPVEALGAFTDHVDRRFRDFDAGFQAKLMDAMKWEDKLLQQHIAKHRLAQWVAETFRSAEVEVEDIADEAKEARMGALES